MSFSLFVGPLQEALWQFLLLKIIGISGALSVFYRASKM
jgi:hypothetical protein